MSVFAECLEEGELPDRWRPLIQRLADRAATDWPSPLPSADDFYVWDAIECPATQAAGGLLIWADLTRPDTGSVVRTLGAQVDTEGLRCGPLNGHSPGGPEQLEDLTWFALPSADRTLTELADELLDWFTREALRWAQITKHDA
ncbi:hypothetical protein G5C51_27455 [Streptomyces sp. A7024]|uniref:Uncharacterized protein n=1 Tax=Streptomyces coryli TaxID=1128680 RepID=A0A6G4U5W4_9ACTN|nr:hypothetical protein [Streptomyces coryli]NGN67625.1 hypothetical protein [Streptomyces coryli]